MKKIFYILIPLLFLLSGCGPIYKGTIVCTKVYDENYYHKLEWNYIDDHLTSNRDTLYVPLEWVDLEGQTLEEAQLYYINLFENVGGTFEYYVDENGILYEEGYVDYTLTDIEPLRDYGFWLNMNWLFSSHREDGYTCENHPEFDPDRI